MRVLAACYVLWSWLLLSSAADAFCAYHGVMYAKTTVGQEFHDSRWVVRVRLLAADDHWSDEDDSWALYHVQVLRSYKGAAPSRLDVFTYRNSGGFYLDQGLRNDLGGEYLLFLNPTTQSLPAAAKGAFEVNYACGQSEIWSKVSPAEQVELDERRKSPDQTHP